MYTTRFKTSNRSQIVKKESPKLFRVYVDNTGDFSINAFGFIRSQFADLQDSNNAAAYAAALSQMQDKFGESLPENLTFEEAVALIRPRWCQSPAELDRFEKYCIDNALDVYRKLKKDTDEDVKRAVGAADQAADTRVVSDSE